MPEEKIYLIGGAIVKEGESEQIDRRALANSKNKNIFVIDLTTDDEEKIKDYKMFFKDYFMKLGALKVKFASEGASKINVNDFGIIYIPGGNTQLLMNNLKKHKLINFLRDTYSLTVGNSAGALILCKKMVLTPDKYHDDFKTSKMLFVYPACFNS